MKKNFTTLKSAMMLICALLMVQFGIAQRTTIAGWSVPDTITTNVYPADCGTGILYLDGTHGSSHWTISSSSSCSNAATFKQAGFFVTETILACPEDVKGKCIAFAGANTNDSCVTFVFSTAERQAINLSYDCRTTCSSTSCGYRTCVWSYSVDNGVTFADLATINYTNTSTDTAHHFFDFSDVQGLNNASNVILRFTGSGAMGTSGTCRLDNILISGEGGGSTETASITASTNSLSFTESGESRTFTVTGNNLEEAITLTSSNSDFTVTPATLAATAENATVTVTFNGTVSTTGTVTLTSGTASATVALNAVIPVIPDSLDGELIYSVGFENSEGFVVPEAYSSYYATGDVPDNFGPDSLQWEVYHGRPSEAASSVITGSQSMQMRYYTSSSHIGHLGYAKTNFDLHNATRMEFSAKSTKGLKLNVSFSRDGGETYEGDSLYENFQPSQRLTYFISDEGEYNTVRLKFSMVLPADTPTSNADLIIDAVEVYGITGIVSNIVETPVISVASGTYMTPQTVSITCETEGASIYYTTDGTTPDQTSTLYENPLTIDSICTLKAKAFKDGMDPSNVASATYNFPVSVATIADFKAAGALDRTVTYQITGDITFVYRQDRRIFVEDATGGLLVYDESNPIVTGEYNEGDVISGGIVGTYTIYNGMVELIPIADWAAASGTATVTPVVATIDDITSDFATYEARLVRINAGVFAEDATFSTNSTTNATLTDATGDIVVRNQFKTLDTTITAGDSVDVIGFAAIYATNSTTYQIFPRTNADIFAHITETPEDTTSTDPEDTVGIRTMLPVILTVYPNPATDVITVSVEENGGSLEVLNAFGQVVYRNNAPVYPMTVDMRSKAAGLYFVRVITADRRIAVIKFTKE